MGSQKVKQLLEENGDVSLTAAGRLQRLQPLELGAKGTSGGTAGAVAAEMPQARPAGYLEVISQANMKLMNLEPP
uniref:Uncharacterized protein n=1 Tax=Sphaerodactylus townsendi TaxID=933632 RepID=A0ACB8EDY1_9SAUR